MRRHGYALAIATAIVVALGAAGCLGDGASTEASLGGELTNVSEQIPQPVVKGLPVAPESERVDLSAPTFSDPTAVTNPLFPVSGQASVLLLGHVDGQPFRTR